MRIITLMCLLIVIVLSVTTLAQDDDLQSLGITSTQRGMYWSTDSQRVVFFGQWDEENEENWITVDINTFDLSESSSFPLHQNVTDDERQQFDLSPLVIESPNGELLLYTKRRNNVGDSLLRYQVIIANRLTGEMFETGIFDFDALDSPGQGNLYVLWSTESNAVAIEQISYSGVPVVYHVSIPDSENFQTAVTTRFGEPINGVVYATPSEGSLSLSDIHPDGSRVLLLVNINEVGVNASQEEQVILEWDPLNPDQSQVMAQLPLGLGVSYAPHTDNEFIYWKEQGPVSLPQDGAFYRFDRSTNIEQLLWQSPFPIVGIGMAPNSRWSVILDENRGVYLLDLYTLLMNMPTASAGTGLYPIWWRIKCEKLG